MRARATAEAVSIALGLDEERLRYRKEIYEADLDVLLDLVRGLDDACGHVLLVGHNPGITDLWNHLSTEKTDNIPTCGVFSLDLPAASWREVGAGSGRPAFTAIPRQIDEVPGKGVNMGKKEKEKEKGGCLHGKSEAKKKPGNFTCDKCGAVSAEKKHLCKPKKIKRK